MTSPAIAHKAPHHVANDVPSIDASLPALPPFAMSLPVMSFPADPSQIIRSRFLTPFAEGREPVCRIAKFSCSDDQTCDMPSDHIVAQYGEASASLALVETPTVTALVQHNCGSGGSVTVRARTSDEADRALAVALSWFPGRAQTDDTQVEVDFWQRGQNMYTTTRSIKAPAWTEVRANYPGEVSAHLGELMETTLDESPGGRIMLWHGPPGTGKTTAIRTLARAWRDQAQVQVVLDPESVFTDAAALMKVLLDAQGSTEDQWRVLVIEDADELVRAGNDRAGRSLSRMLNVGDGIVGQGLKVLILLTTNEPPDRLHPALSRPGRCMSQVWFRKFRRPEAQVAFAHLDHLPDGQELSLAEIMNGEQPSPPAAQTPLTGTYL